MKELVNMGKEILNTLTIKISDRSIGSIGNIEAAIREYAFCFSCFTHLAMKTFNGVSGKSNDDMLIISKIRG
jgi:coenzyme F420-reducing hydrogenase alpha subunit